MCPVEVADLIKYTPRYYQQETYNHHSGFIRPEENKNKEYISLGLQWKDLSCGEYLSMSPHCIKE